MKFIIILTVMLFTFSPAAAFDYFEDFDDGVADGFQPISGAWTTIDGTYTSEISGFGNFSYTRFGEDLWLDYVVECDILVTGSINHVVHVRGDGLNNTYSINIRSEPYNDIIIAKRTNGSRIILASTPYENVAGEWHNLLISAIGSYIKVTADRTETVAIDDTNSPFMQGPVYLIAYSGGVGYQQAWFDNLGLDFYSVPNEDHSWSEVKNLFR